MTRFALLLFLLAPPSGLSAQAPASQAASTSVAAPQLSPKAAYDEAMHPLDLTRRNIANWSSAEMASLTVTLARAREACRARDVHQYAGADLIDLARLCALGQEWGTVVLATTRYIDDPAPNKPLLPEAHAARVDADLHLKSEPDTFRDTETMYTAVPYTPIVAEASTEAIEYMRFSTPEDALTLAQKRQPLVLTQLQAWAAAQAPAAQAVAGTKGQKPVSSSVLPASSAAPLTGTPPLVATPTPRASVHELYAQGMLLAALQQFAKQPDPAAATVADLDRVLPSSLAPDDAIAVEAERRRYALVGKPLPNLAIGKALSAPYTTPVVPANHSITVLLLFPDWCAQCVASMSELPETVFRIAGHEAYYYGLLAETVPERSPDGKAGQQPLAATFSPAFAASLLAERPVLTVAPNTLQQFAAADFPFLVVTDWNGIVRVAQPIDADDLNSGGKVDSAVAVVGGRWPGPALPPGKTPAPAPAAPAGNE